MTERNDRARHLLSDPTSFVAWNEGMVTRYDPERYHTCSHPVIRWIERRRTRAIVRLLQAHAMSQVLEVGCGAGNVLEQVSSSRRIGVDLSSRMVSRARTRLARCGDHVIRGRAEQLPFLQASFERIICSEVLEHLPDPTSAFHEMLRVVTPNGRIVISIPNEPLIDRLKALARAANLHRLFRTVEYQSPNRMTDEWHLHAFTLSRVLQLVSLRTRVIKIVGIPHRLLPIRYVVAIVPQA